MNDPHRATQHKTTLISVLDQEGADFTVHLAMDQLAGIAALLGDVLGPYEAADILHRTASAIVEAPIRYGR